MTGKTKTVGQHPCSPGGKEVTMMVADACPPSVIEGVKSCKNTADIDVSELGWKEMTGDLLDTRIWGTWRFLDACPESFSSGKLILQFSSDATKWQFRVQPLNAKRKITKIEFIEHGKRKRTTITAPIDQDPKDHPKCEAGRDCPPGLWWSRNTNTHPGAFMAPATFIATNDQGYEASGELDSLDGFKNRMLPLDREL